MVSEAASPEIDRAGTSAFTTQDRGILADVNRALADGLSLREWWQQRDAADGYAERFELMRTFNPADRAIGFFDNAPLPSGSLPVMGVVQEMGYDRAKQAPIDKVLDEFRQFLLGDFMRVSSFLEPDAYTDWGRAPVPPSLEFLSWFPGKEEPRIGFGYSQYYYKLRDSGVVGKFPRKDEFAIVDLREIREGYEWLVAKVRVFNFNLTFRPFGPESISFNLPLKEETYLILSPDFITYRDHPTPGVLGQYGFGYALLKYEPAPSVFAFGPGHFRAGFQLINFEVLERGDSRVRMVFVVNRPDRILKLDLDPIGWSFRLADVMSLGLASRILGPFKEIVSRFPIRVRDFDPVTAYITLANLVTAGEAARQLGISKKQLEKEMLVQHFMEHYQMIVGSLLTWRQIPDWLDRGALPDWAITGKWR